jgi:hypothetical protein
MTHGLLVRIPSKLLDMMFLIAAVGVAVLLRSVYVYIPAGLLILDLTLAKASRIQWDRLVRSGELSTGKVRYVDRPPLGISSLILAGSFMLFGAILSQIVVIPDFLDLTGLQCALIPTVFFLFPTFQLLFFPVKYTVTDQGIWIQKGTLTAFIAFEELKEASLMPQRMNSVRGYEAPITRYSNFVLLLRKRTNWRQKNILLTPGEPTEFIQYLPSGLMQGSD